MSGIAAGEVAASDAEPSERASLPDVAIGDAAKPVQDEDARMRQRLSWLMGARLLVATLLLGGTAFFVVDPKVGFEAFTPRFLVTLIAATYAVSLVFAVWLPRTASLTRVAAVQLAFDMMLTTGLVYVSGGVASGFTFLYGVSILMAALIVGPRATHATAVSTLLIYTVAGVSIANGWFPHPPDQPPERYVLAPEVTGYAILSNIVGLLLVTILASTLATRVRRTGAELVKATENVASLARLNDDIVRSLTSGLLTADLDGRVLTVNPAGAEIFGGGSDAMVGSPVEELLPVDAVPSGAEAEAPAGTRGEGEARRLTGEPFPVGFTTNPLVDADGVVTGTLITFQDLSEIEALRNAAQRAERLAALGRLATGLAHEIRNPLSSISGSVELVREGRALGDEDKKLLGIVLAEVERLNDLVTTMLHVGRPKPPHRAPHDVVELVDDVVQMARRGPARVVDVRIELTTPARAVASIDAGQVRQLVWNLLKNALQASPQGGSVWVRVKVRDAGVEVEVKDEGEGIPAEMRARLFETFFSGRQHGVGLGLALVRQIVEAHEGTVDVDTAPGEGAVFRVFLPGPVDP